MCLRLNKINSIGLLLLVIGLWSCHGRKPVYDRESYLLKYLQNEQQVNLSRDSTYRLMIIQSGNCGNCNPGIMGFTEEVLPPSSQSIILFAGDLKEVVDTFSQKKMKVLVNNGQMARYGLYSIENMFFIIKGNHVVYWKEVVPDNYKDIRENIAKLD
jgi:hypothetical protein